METEMDEGTKKTIDDKDCQVVGVNLNRKQKRKVGSVEEPQPKWTKSETDNSSQVKVESDDGIKIGSVESDCKSEPISSGAVWCDNEPGTSASSLSEPSSADGTLSNIKKTQVGSDEKPIDTLKDTLKDAVLDCATSGEILMDYKSLDNHKTQEQSLTVDVAEDEVCNDQNDMSDLTGNDSIAESNVLSIAPFEDSKDGLDLKGTKSSHPYFGEVYNCEVCEQGFLHKGNLVKHSRIHNVQKRQVCFICGAGFDGTESLKTHLVTHKGSAQMVPEDLSRYVKVHNGQHMPYVCNLCGRGYSNMNNANKHLRKHKDGYSCHVCGRENITSGICTTKSGICMLARSCGEFANDSRISSTFSNSNMSVTPGLEVESLQSNTPQKPPTKLFKCASCGNRFTNLLEFTNHKPHGYCHHVPDIPAGPILDVSIFLCDMCNRRFTDKLELDDHYASHYFHSTGDVCFSCNVCGTQFTKSHHLKHHSKVREHQGQVHACTFCGTTYKYRNSMENHLRKVHGLTSDLEQHISFPKDCTIQMSEKLPQISPGISPGMTPGTTPEFDGSVTLVKSEHTASDTNIELDASDFCAFDKIKCEPIGSSDSTSCTTGAIVSTAQLHDPESDKNVKPSSNSSPDFNFSEIRNCDICEQGFLREGNLVKHSRIHRSGKNQMCLICEQNFKEADGLKSHMAVHEGSALGHLSKGFRIHAGTRRPFVCILCSSGFAHVANATMHLRQHKFGYSCDICGRERLTKGICQTKRDLCKLAENLENSHELQKRAKLYKCVGCCNRFNNLQEFTNHQKSHRKCFILPNETTKKTGESKFTCQLCSERFTEKMIRDEHYSSHYAEDVDYSCNVCGQHFTKISHLEHHVKLQFHLNQIYICRFCGMFSKRRLTIVNHLRKVHKLHSNLDRHIHSIEHSLLRPAKPLDPQILSTAASKSGSCGRHFSSRLDLQNHEKFSEACGKSPSATPLVDGSAALVSEPSTSDAIIKMGVSDFCKSDNIKCIPIDSSDLIAVTFRSVDSHGNCTTKLDTIAQGYEAENHKNAEPSSKSPPGYRGELHNCDICGQGFLHEGNLMKHSRIHGNGKHLICYICEKSFEETGSLKSHTAIHESSAKMAVPGNIRGYFKVLAGSLKPYVCSLCGASYAQVSQTATHLQKHKDGYSCDVCGRENLSKGVCQTKHNMCKLATNHNAEVSPMADPSQESQTVLFKCIHCGNRFTSILAFTNHMKSEGNCSRLQRETAAKSNVSTFICDFCSKRFTDKLKLDDHYASHYTGNVSYSCSLCGRQFAKIHHLEHHLKVRGHYIQVHVCQLCGLIFHQLSIDNHLKTAHDLEHDLEQHVNIISGCVQEL